MREPRSPLHFACDEFVAVVTEYLEGTLVDMQLFEEHLAFCDGCGSYLRQIEHTVALAAALHDENVPQPVLESLRSLYRNAGPSA